jgi:hypothetical protein
VSSGDDAAGAGQQNGAVSSDAATVLGLLADADRLRVVAALALGAHTPADVAAAAGLDVPTTGRLLARLTSGGLVEQERNGYRLVTERFGEALRSLAPREPDRVESGLGPDADRVLRSFLRDGKLASIPVVRSKRQVVLDYLAGLFEPGKEYPETEVNERLGAVHPDYAALRRYLVDEGFLSRRGGVYWRVGGTFEV